MNTNSIPYLDKLLDYNQQLIGLPALPLLFIGCLAFGYMVKGFPFISNRFIPTCVVLLGIVGNMALCLDNLQANWRGAVVTLVRQGALGGIVSALAWFVHNKWIKPVEDKVDKDQAEESPKS